MTISTFTVTVPFKGVVYDVEITPTLNGKPLEYLQDRIDRWNEAEKAGKIFSRKIAEMLQETVESDPPGQLTMGSEKGFTFEDATQAQYKTDKLWKEFIDCLHNPAPYIASLPERMPAIGGQALTREDKALEASPARAVGRGADLRFAQNPYLNLSEDEKREVRERLYVKKCREHLNPEAKLDYDETEEDKEAEEACLAYHVYKDHRKSKMSPIREALILWNSVDQAERDALSLLCLEAREHFDELREESEVIQGEEDLEEAKGLLATPARPPVGLAAVDAVATLIQ